MIFLCKIVFGSGPVAANPLRSPGHHALHLNARLNLEQQAQAEYERAVVLHGQQAAAESVSAWQAMVVSGPGVRVWENYVAHDPSYWLSVRAPKITLAVRAWMLSTVTEADPTADPMTEYLLWRRSLAPARFDYYHPHLGSELQNLIPTTASSTTPPGTGTSPANPSTPATAPTPTQSQAQLPIPSSTTTSGSVPSAVPEPSAATMALMMVASVTFSLWHRSRES